MRVKASVILLFAAFSSIATIATVEGATAEDYRVSSSGSTPRLKKGTSGVLVLRLEALHGFHFSAQTPLLASLSSSSGIAFPKRRLDRKDLASSTSTILEWRTDYAARAPGQQEITADLVFFLCTENDCDRKSATYALAISVE